MRLESHLLLLSNIWYIDIYWYIDSLIYFQNVSPLLNREMSPLFDLVISLSWYLSLDSSGEIFDTLVKWKIKNIIFPLLKCSWSLNVMEWWLSGRTHSHEAIWTFNHVKLQYKQVIFPLPPYQFPSNISSWWLMRVFHPKSQISLKPLWDS